MRTHGITRDPSRMTREPDGPWYYQQIELGWNYRMTEMQGALGLSQMDRLDKFVSRRREIALDYDQALARSALASARKIGRCKLFLASLRDSPGGSQSAASGVRGAASRRKLGSTCITSPSIFNLTTKIAVSRAEISWRQRITTTGQSRFPFTPAWMRRTKSGSWTLCTRRLN